MATTTPQATRDTGSFGWAVLGFFVPLAGLILWLVWRNDRPGDSRQSRNGFIAGLIVSVVLWILYVVAMSPIFIAIE